jgi:hypothetical protein
MLPTPIIVALGVTMLKRLPCTERSPSLLSLAGCGHAYVLDPSAASEAVPLTFRLLIRHLETAHRVGRNYEAPFNDEFPAWLAGTNHHSTAARAADLLTSVN